MNRSIYVGKLLTVALLTLALAGCGQAVDHTIAGAIKSALPNAIGPAQSYNVSVNADPLEVARGHLREVDIVGTDVNLSPQLLIDQLNVTAKDIDADVRTHHVKSVGQVVFGAQIGQDSINHYLAAQLPDSAQRQENLSVVLNDHTVTATLLVKALGISVPASVTGSFAVDAGNPKKMNFVVDRGSLSIVPLPIFALRLALEKINPVIDLTNSIVPVEVDSVSIQAGKLILTGKADLQNGLAQNT